MNKVLLTVAACLSLQGCASVCEPADRVCQLNDANRRAALAQVGFGLTQQAQNRHPVFFQPAPQPIRPPQQIVCQPNGPDGVRCDVH